MEYHKNLLQKRKKSKYLLILGISSFVFAIIMIVVIMGKDDITWWNWTYAVLLLLNGISNSAYGLGYSFGQFFGRAFIHIDDQVIKLKPDPFVKEQKLNWHEIDTIDHKPGYFLITKNDNSTLKLPLTKLEYSVIQQVKDTIGQIANKKKISINLNQ